MVASSLFDEDDDDGDLFDSGVSASKPNMAEVNRTKSNQVAHEIARVR